MTITNKTHQPQTVSDKRRPHVVIIGAGFGGLQAARVLGKAPVRLTVLDRTNHHLFQPLLYQVATAALSPADISATTRFVLRKQKNTRVLLEEVTGIDIEEKRVLMGEQAIDYDYLIVATGAHENYFGHDEWKQYAPGLKNIEDAREIRRKILTAFEQAEAEHDPERIQELLTFIVIGGGPTGVEMAGAIAEMAHKTLAGEFQHINPAQAHIVLVEALPRILNAFPDRLANKALKELRRHGVDIKTNTPIAEVDADGVIFKNGERMNAATVIWTAGVQASPAGKWLNAEVDRAGRVKVQDDLSAPGHPEIFVIGDTAIIMQNGKPLPGVAPVAMQEGRYVAQVITDRVEGREHGPSFHYVDKGNLATVGRAYAIVELGKIRFTGFIAWLLWLLVHIYYLIGFQNRIMVMMQWAWAYLTYRRRARIITTSSRLMMPAPQHREDGTAPEANFPREQDTRTSKA